MLKYLVFHNRGVEMLNYVNILVFSRSLGVAEYESEIGDKNKVCQHTSFKHGTIQLLTTSKICSPNSRQEMRPPSPSIPVHFRQ